MKGREIFKKAPFPAAAAVAAGVLFCGVYWLLTAGSVRPHYLPGLFFAVPAACLGAVAWLTAGGRLGAAASAAFTVALIVVLGFASAMSLLFIAVGDATATTTDTAKYGRVLRLSGYPRNSLLADFPGRIPSGANDVAFRYQPGFLQGGCLWELRFDTDAGTAAQYADAFAARAQWAGKMSDPAAQTHGIIDGMFVTGADSPMRLPDDFTVYWMAGRPYRPGDWNHGSVRLTAVSTLRDEILFHAEKW